MAPSTSLQCPRSRSLFPLDIPSVKCHLAWAPLDLDLLRVCPLPTADRHFFIVAAGWEPYNFDLFWLCCYPLPPHAPCPHASVNAGPTSTPSRGTLQLYLDVRLHSHSSNNETEQLHSGYYVESPSLSQNIAPFMSSPQS